MSALLFVGVIAASDARSMRRIRGSCLLNRKSFAGIRHRRTIFRAQRAAANVVFALRIPISMNGKQRLATLQRTLLALRIAAHDRE
jgi:hypothetical protein